MSRTEVLAEILKENIGSYGSTEFLRWNVIASRVIEALDANGLVLLVRKPVEDPERPPEAEPTLRDSFSVYASEHPCPKCGASFAKAKYLASRQLSLDWLKDVIQRTCTVCEYVWYERPIG